LQLREGGEACWFRFGTRSASAWPRLRVGRSPRWGFLGLAPFSQGLRHGLHSYAALRLGTGRRCRLAWVRLSKINFISWIILPS